jgi:hypothetical protein
LELVRLPVAELACVISTLLRDLRGVPDPFGERYSMIHLLIKRLVSELAEEDLDPETFKLVVDRLDPTTDPKGYSSKRRSRIVWNIACQLGYKSVYLPTIQLPPPTH